jgi:hypothetical protein
MKVITVKSKWRYSTVCQMVHYVQYYAPPKYIRAIYTKSRSILFPYPRNAQSCTPNYSYHLPGPNPLLISRDRINANTGI